MTREPAQVAPPMTIGAFARASRLSVKALRLYEQHGLLTPAEVDAATGYRYYLPGQLKRARLHAGLRELAMPLKIVADILDAEDQAEADRGIAFWWAGQERATRVRRELVQSLRAEANGTRQRTSAPFPVSYRNVAERTLLTEQSQVDVDQLPTFIATAVARLAPWSAARPGTPDLPVVVTYHGRVNEDSDGPVEVCLIQTPDSAITIEQLPTGLNLRREAPHREAFTTLTKSDVVYPDILVAYDQLEAQVTNDGHTPSGPPREYYFTDIHAAQPDDPVCHAALPIS